MGRFVSVVAAQADLLNAKAQLAAGFPRHRVTRWLLDRSGSWDSISVGQLRWQIEAAKELGSSLQPVLSQLIDQDRRAFGAAQSVQRALQVPRLTSKLIAFMPWIGLAVSQSLGLSPLRFLLFSPWGWGLLAISAGLQFGASYFSRRTLSGFTNFAMPDPGAPLEAMALALDAGIGFRRARASVQKHCGQAIEHLSGFELGSTLGALDSYGLGVSHQLRAQAEFMRHQQNHELTLRLEKLGVKLLVPLAAFLLPQFMLLTVVPIAVSSILF
jgi:tight adherence protein B